MGALERYKWVRFAGKLSPRSAMTHRKTVSVPVGRWIECLGRFKIQALTYCNANVMSTRTTAGQFKCEFKGAMDESSGKGSKMQAHISSGVVMDVAAFKVSHSVDIDPTALQAKKWSA